MKINKQTKSKSKFLIICLLAALCVVVGYGFYASSSGLWPFETKSVTNPPATSSDQNSKDTTKDSGSSNSGSVDNNKNDDTNNIPITNPPKVTDSYPIQNDHYKIAQDGPKDYRITLYPIINNPDISDYDAQLKAYKQEALDYLKKRYGNINDFRIKWTPSDAANA